MKQEQQQHQITSNVLIRFYLFLRDRDARIIELFFFAINVYILALIIFPPYIDSGWQLAARLVFQLLVTGCNMVALIYQHTTVRVISAIANAAIMGLITAVLWGANNPHTGTYAIITVLAAFICWKITTRQH